MLISKQEVDDLALFGGAVAFDEALHVGRPNIGDRKRFIARINEMFNRRWLTNNGPYVLELEEKLARYLGVKNCIAVCNATVALEIGAKALDLKDEVIVPSFTFIATAHALQWLGITPVFCDIDPHTHNIDPIKIENLITERTTGILGVHVWGRACDVETLRTITKKHGLKLMFDAAHAFACSHHGEMIGSFGDIEVFSFHATKFFNSFEGGAITTNDDSIAQKIREMRNFGFAGFDTVIAIGTNGKMSEPSAAMALTSLESIDEFIDINHQNYLAYQHRLADIPGLSLVTYNESEHNNFQYIVIEVDEIITKVHRDLLARILHAENILVRRYFYPGCHQMEPYRTKFPGAGLNLTATEQLTQKVLQLPTGTSISKFDIEYICNLIHFVINNSEEINNRIKQISAS